MLLMLLVACTGDPGKALGESLVEDSGADVVVAPEPLAVVINELMPSNGGAYRTRDGRTPDWLELYNPGAAEVALAGWFVTDGVASLQLEGVLGAGAFRVVELDADGGPRLSAEGGVVALRDARERESRLTFGATARDFVHRRATDGCSGAGCWGVAWGGTPGRSNVVNDPVEVELLARGASWSYWDRAEAPAGTWWLAVYDDASWARGAAPLGYGAVQATVTSYGADPYAKPLTQWFRTRVTLSETRALTRAWVELVRDDGARVVVNGVEVARSNLPAGELVASTPASSSVGDAAETTPVRCPFDAAVLVDGENVIAVEVHQYAPDSSDLSFDLGMGGQR